MNNHPRKWSFPRVPASFLVLVLLSAGLYWWFKPPPRSTHGPPGPLPPGKLEIFRTKGGLLEVAGFTKTEDDLSKDRPSWRGTSSSSMRLDATYRYSIVLPEEWKIIVDDTRGVATIVAPPYMPQLPVAVDSKSVMEWTESGWGRFDKWDLLQELRSEISSQLADKARSDDYRSVVEDAARKTVEEFVYDWFLKQKGWSRDSQHVIKVYFVDEKDVPLPQGYDIRTLLPKQ
jgi:hypothetical protein